MRPPVPVVVDNPRQISDTKLPEGTFLITVAKDNFITRFNDDTIICRDISELESLIDLQGAEKLNGHVALQVDVAGTSPNINSVIELLKRKKIIRFNLVTDLEQ